MSHKFEYDEQAGDQPGPGWIGDRQLTWRECLEQVKADAQQAYRWARLVADLDRSPAGRHEGDAESQDPTGISQGNPYIRTGDVIGYTISGAPISMPERGQRGKIEAWLLPTEEEA